MPEAVCDELLLQLAPYRSRHPDVRWTRAASWHLTLLFLGAVEPTRVPELERLVDTVAVETEPYRAHVERGGGRIQRGQGVAWLGLGSGAGTLIATADAVAEACPVDITTGPPAKRTPSAHLTVARKADEPVIEALRTQAYGPIGVGWVIDRIVLVRSHLEPDGARYQTLYGSTL